MNTAPSGRAKQHHPPAEDSAHGGNGRLRSNGSNPKAPRRRGRPPGSESLTKERYQTILTYIRAGAFDYVAAEAAGVSARTFREWVARGEGTHPTRGSTPKLRRFAKEVRRAKAEVRAAAEVRMHREHPAQWLKYVARTRPEREGWTEPRAGKAGEPTSGDSFEERLRRYDEWKRQNPSMPTVDPGTPRPPVPEVIHTGAAGAGDAGPSMGPVLRPGWRSAGAAPRTPNRSVP
jgi:hypothetical protein